MAPWTLLLVALVALAGHLCVLPAAGHAHPEEGTAAGREVHAGSCEAIRADRALPVVAGPLASVSLPESPEPGIAFPAGPRPVPTRHAGPPRFLLHAALLI